VIIIGEEWEFKLDTTQVDQQIEQTDNKIENTKENLLDMTKEVAKETEKSFNEVMGYMRASYQMFTGLSQLAGGSVNKIFSSMFQVAIATIGTYKAIATAMAASGVGTVQAILMFSSLVTAISGLVTAATGQRELERRLSGMNQALHGISSLIGYMAF